jgi:hypothetical protein
MNHIAQGSWNPGLLTDVLHLSVDNSPTMTCGLGGVKKEVCCEVEDSFIDSIRIELNNET